MFEIPASYQPLLVIGLLCLVFYGIYTNKVTPFKGLFAAVIAFLALGIVTIEEILVSVSNPSIAVIMMLILVASAIMKHYPILPMMEKLVVSKKGYKPFLGSGMFLTGLLSSVLNNTAVVAILTPLMYNWGVKNKVSPGKLLMPLSFAAISGGMITIIGTSTTLVLNGLMTESGFSSLNPWFLLACGTTILVMGILYFLLFGNKILPENEELLQRVNQRRKDYLIELKVKEDSPLIGKKISEGGLRQLESFFLAEIIRQKETIAPVGPEQEIKANDVLIFAGDTTNFDELLNKNIGLILPIDTRDTLEFKRISEVVISHNSSLIGVTVKESDFRQKYDAAVIAVHRNGTQLRGKIGKIELQAGDVLLVFSGDDFMDKLEEYRDFYLISNTENPIKKDDKRIYPLFVTLGAAVLAVVTGNPGLAGVMVVLTGCLILFNILTMRIIRREFDLDLAGTLIFSLVVGKAVLNSGTGQWVADSIMGATGGDAFLSILGLILITTLLTTFITNVAAVSIVFPIAVQLSATFPSLTEAFFVAIAFSASAAFVTPIGYQTNLMVAGPGGYTFAHFFKNGFPYLILYLLILVMYLFLFFF